MPPVTFLYTAVKFAQQDANGSAVRKAGQESPRFYAPLTMQCIHPHNDENASLVLELLDDGAESISALSNEQKSTPRYINTKQAASYLNLSSQYLEIARHKGGGPQYIKLAKTVRYRKEDLDAWMAEHIRKHTAENTYKEGDE